MEQLIFVLEVVGTVAFASTGALVGIRHGMDVFGVVVLALLSALGGGLVRDIILGANPPSMFQDARYATIAILWACLLFTVLYFNRQLMTGRFVRLYDRIMLVCDAIGLGVFTVVGVETAYSSAVPYGVFMLVFVGVLTGVGGGLLRDVLAGVTPYIFVKHIYACASILGALACILLWNVAGKPTAMLVGAGVTIATRFVSAWLKLNLPKIPADTGKP